MVDIAKLQIQVTEKASWMCLSLGQKAKTSLKLQMPHQKKPMRVSQIEKSYPEFAKQLDGALSDSTIEYFWKRDKSTGIYKFVDDDAKEEVAEMMGVECADYSSEDEEKDDPSTRRQLTDAEIQDFREYLADAHEVLRKIGHRA
jgi:hypothetical protein